MALLLEMPSSSTVSQDKGDGTPGGFLNAAVSCGSTIRNSVRFGVNPSFSVNVIPTPFVRVPLYERGRGAYSGKHILLRAHYHLENYNSKNFDINFSL
jgi:hypothetical protein